MHPKNRASLAARVGKAADAALAARGYATALDVLTGIGWLDDESLKRWRHGQIGYLERVVQANLSRISEAMRQFRLWGIGKGLRPSEMDYRTWGNKRRPLRFSKSGHPNVERWYRTHWVSRALAEEKRKREAEKARRKPPPRPAREVEEWDIVDTLIEQEIQRFAERESPVPPRQPRRPPEVDDGDIPF